MYLEVSFYAYAATVWLTEAKLLQKRNCFSNKKILEIAEYINRKTFRSASLLQFVYRTRSRGNSHDSLRKRNFHARDYRGRTTTKKLKHEIFGSCDCGCAFFSGVIRPIV